MSSWRSPGSSRAAAAVLAVAGALAAGRATAASTAGRQQPLPQVFLQVDQRIVPAYAKLPASIAVVEPQRPRWRSAVAVEVRGNTSRKLFPKKSYTFELRHSDGRERKASLLGMPAHSDWLLVACYADKTCVRDALAHALARDLGRYAPRTRFVELFIDGEYRGLYLLMERLGRGRGRLDLPRPAADEDAGDISGGYIVRREGRGKGHGDGWKTRDGIKWMYYYPRHSKMTDAQKSYLKRAMERLEASLRPPAAGAARPEDYRRVIDVPSFVDFALMQELTSNVDGYWKSLYLHKQPDSRGGRFHAGPAWDFDIAFGNANFNEGWRTDVWAHEANRFEMVNEVFVPPFWQRLWNDPAFARAAARRWRALRRGPLGWRRLSRQLDRLSTETAAARGRDQARWPTVGQDRWPNWYIGSNAAEELAWLRNWLEARLAWLDRNLDAGATGTAVAASGARAEGR